MPTTFKEVKNRYKTMLETKLKGRRPKGSYVSLDWPGCINSGADTKIIYWGKDKWEVRVPSMMLNKYPALKRESKIGYDKFGFGYRFFTLTTKGRAIQKMLTVSKGIIEAAVDRENEKERLAKAIREGDHETAFDAMMELR